MRKFANQSLFFAKAIITAVLIGCTGIVSAALEPRLGGDVVYDTDRGLSILANANLAASETFGIAGINADGSMDWITAFNWVQAMNAANYLGFNDWRLANAINPELRATVRSCRTNVTYCINGDLAHLFLNELSGAGVQGGISGITDPDISLFWNFPQNSAFFYWTGTNASRGRFHRHRTFTINNLRMYVHRVSNALPGFVLPVRDGDVGGSSNSSGGNAGNGNSNNTGATPPAVDPNATKYKTRGRITAINASNIEINYKTIVWYTDTTKIKFGPLGDFGLTMRVKIKGRKNPDGQVIASKITVK